MITYPVSPDSRWSVLRISTGEIVGRNKAWPVADGTEIQGADPDYVYLLQSEDAQPDYDSRLYVLSSQEVVDVPANTIQTTYSTAKRPKPERVTAAENEEAAQVDKHFPLEKITRETAMMVGLIYHYAIDGQAIPPRFQGFAEDYRNKVKDKLLKNRDRLQAILADIEADNDPDLDAGWEDA